MRRREFSALLGGSGPKKPRPYYPTDVARHRRRGEMICLLAAVHESACGTKRTLQTELMSVFGGKADMALTCRNVL
jgi:hypothetical protein